MLPIVVCILFLTLIYLTVSKPNNRIFACLLVLVIVFGGLVGSISYRNNVEGFLSHAYVNYKMPCGGLKLSGKDDLTNNQIATWEGRRLVHKDKSEGDCKWRHGPCNLPLLSDTVIHSPVGDGIKLTEDPVSYSFNTVDGTNDPKKPRQMFMFAHNQCRPECCPSAYSCDHGCVCTTEQQRKFINSRGNNRSNIDTSPPI